MTTYTSTRLTQAIVDNWNGNGNAAGFPAKANPTDVLYYIEGTLNPNAVITTYSVTGSGDNETTVASTTTGPGIEWSTPVASDLAIGDWAADKTSVSATGTKHGFLITQQVLCHGGIHAVYTADVESRRLYGEYAWGATAMQDTVSVFTIAGRVIPAEERIEGKVIAFPNTALEKANYVIWVRDGKIVYKEPFKDSLRLNVFLNGNVADPLVVANDAARSTAVFTDCAYATGVFWLNREEPQFIGGSAPDVQFYVDGMLVKVPVSKTALSTTKYYTNNPVACLLDYLMSSKYGLGLTEDSIDIESFYNSYVICDQTKVTDVPLEGAFWKTKGGPRSVKLYECNLTLDTSKPLRDNVNAIMATMNDATLVWSGGKYKLTVAYPNIWGSSGTVSNLRTTT